MYPRQAGSFIVSVAVIATFAACASTDGDSAATDTAASAAAAADATTSTLACFVRGTSLEEARTRPSPLGEVRFSLGGDEGLLCYGRPSANDRVVMGELVPYGAPWRLGANEATAIHVTFPAEIGDVEVEPGSYSLYAVPGEAEWEIFVNRQVERWGIPINEGVTGENIGSFTRPVARVETPVETLTFSWQEHGEGMGHLVMEWENSRVEIPVHRRGD